MEEFKMETAVTVWDKQSSINGISASEVVKSLGIGLREEIFLVLRGEQVTEVQFKNTIATNYNLDMNLSCEEIAKKYLEIKQQEEKKQKEEIENKQTQQEEMEQLKKETASINYILMKNDLL